MRVKIIGKKGELLEDIRQSSHIFEFLLGGMDEIVIDGKVYKIKTKRLMYNEKFSNSEVYMFV